MANYVHVHHFNNALSEHFDVSLYFRRNSGEGEVIGPEKFRVKYYSALGMGLVEKYLRILYEIVRFSSAIYYTRNLGASLFLSFLNRSHFLELHSYYLRTDAGTFNRFMFNLIVRLRKTRLVFISERLKNLYFDSLADNQRNALKFMVLHDGANLTYVKSKVNVTGNNRITVGYIGSLGPGRGEGLIQDMARRLPDVDFVIYGATEKCDSQLPNNLYYKGFIPNSEVNLAYATFDMVIAPYTMSLRVQGGDSTIDYMSPLKIFEYMNTGRPMIVSDLPVLREILDERSAIFCDPSNVQEWVEAVNDIRFGRIDSESIAMSARRLLNNYTWSKRAQEVKRITEL